MKIRVIELFGGIGACTKALERLGFDVEIADYVEIDKYAVKSFNAMHGTMFEPQDITKWNKSIGGGIDVIMHGSPCQDFSVAGKQAGGDKDSGTRSSLMYETLRIVESIKPRYVVWENVKNLLSQKHRHNFDAYQLAMEQLGYRNYYQVLNAKDYGVPQNRERVFTVSIRNDIQSDFSFPSPMSLENKLQDVLEKEVEDKYYISKAMMDYFMGVNQKPSKFPRRERFLANINRKDQDRANSITTNPGNRPTDNFIIDDTQGFEPEPRIYDKVSPTLRSQRAGLKVANYPRVRKLTPKECWRLMGFDDDSFKCAEKVNSNSQLYKQAGNSIVVDVLAAIFGNLLHDESGELKLID